MDLFKSQKIMMGSLPTPSININQNCMSNLTEHWIQTKKKFRLLRATLYPSPRAKRWPISIPESIGPSKHRCVYSTHLADCAGNGLLKPKLSWHWKHALCSELGYERFLWYTHFH